MVLSAKIRHLRREDLSGWEIDAAKQLTGIIRCGHTFLIRNAEIISRNQHLDIALNLYNGENTNGGINHFTSVLCAEVSAVLFADTLRNPAAAVAALPIFTQLRGQSNGIGDLYSGFGQIFDRSVLAVHMVRGVIGTKDFYIAFAAVQYNTFIKYG